MWRSFASLGLVKHETPHFSTARPTYETGSAKSVIDGNGEKGCLRIWKERLPFLRAARAALALQSRCCLRVGRQPSRKYSERNKTSHGGNERHPYAHRRERSRAPGGALSRFSRIVVFVAPSVACTRRSWIPRDRARYARLRADGSPRTTRSVHAAPSCWRRGRPARCFRRRDGGDRRTRLGRPRCVVRRAFAARSLSRRDRFERAVHTKTTRSSYQHDAPDRGRAVLSAVLPIPRRRRGGVRARCPSEHSQLPLLGLRGRPG